MPRPSDTGTRIVLALPIDKVIRPDILGHGECLACGETGTLRFRLGTKWKARKYSSTELIHKAGCQVNKHLLHQQD